MSGNGLYQFENIVEIRHIEKDSKFVGRNADEFEEAHDTAIIYLKTAPVFNAIPTRIRLPAGEDVVVFGYEVNKRTQRSIAGRYRARSKNEFQIDMHGSEIDCRGLSGAPVFRPARTRWELIGIVSRLAKPDKGCKEGIVATHVRLGEVGGAMSR